MTWICKQMNNELINDYKYGFVTDVESDIFDKGLNEEVVRAISKKKNEPEFMLISDSRPTRNGCQ